MACTGPHDCPCYPTLAPHSQRICNDAHIASVYLNGYGALAEYTRVSAARSVIRPKNVTPTEASGFPIAGITAYQALFHIAKLEEGQSIFINGGSTAVGSFERRFPLPIELSGVTMTINGAQYIAG